MIAVIYMPTEADPETGPIVQAVRGTAANVAATAESIGGKWIEVDTERDDYDTAYTVVDGQVELIDA